MKNPKTHKSGDVFNIYFPANEGDTENPIVLSNTVTTETSGKTVNGLQAWVTPDEFGADVMLVPVAVIKEAYQQGKIKALRITVNMEYEYFEEKVN